MNGGTGGGGNAGEHATTAEETTGEGESAARSAEGENGNASDEETDANHQQPPGAANDPPVDEGGEGDGEGAPPNGTGNGNTPPPDPYVNFEAQTFTELQLRVLDPLLQQFTPADEKLHQVYGDTIHQNDGTHLSGDIEATVDKKWQRLYHRVIAGPLKLWDLPNGRVANRYLDLLTAELKGARLGQWNSERPNIFAPCILHKVGGKKYTFAETKAKMEQRMDAWEAGRHCTLVKMVEEQWRRGGQRRSLDKEEVVESRGRRYKAMVESNRLRPAVRSLTDRVGKGLYKPNDKDTKTGELVIEVLRGKHPKATIPQEAHFDEYEEEPDSLMIVCHEEDVAKQASKLGGAAGPCGVDGETMKSWCLRYKAHSEKLCEEISQWVMLLANGTPHYAKYRSLNHARMLAADKDPGVRPLCCGEIWMRLMGRCVLAAEARELARDACGNGWRARERNRKG